MAAPSISGGYTELHACDTGDSGVAPSTVLASSTPASSGERNGLYQGGINSTGAGQIGNAGTGNGLQGGIYSVTSTDFSTSGRLCVIHSSAGGAVTRIGNISASTGVMLYANSSSLGTEEAAFPLWGGDAPTPAAFSPCVVNMNRSTDAHLYTGSFDPTDVTHIGIISTWVSSFGYVNIDSIGYIDPYLIINGETGNRGNFADLTSQIDTDDTKVNESPTSNIHHCFFAWGVGDGSTLTWFEDSLKTFEFARQVDIAADWGRAHINDNDIGFETNASASDTLSFELCNWISDDAFYWNSIGSTSATVTYTSCIIKNAGDVTIVDGHTFTGCTFDACAEIDATQPTFTNTTFKNAAATALSVGNSGDANMTNCIFDGNQTAIKVAVAGNASLDVTEFTFETNNTYYIEYTGTGTLTVTSPTPIAAGKLNASGGGTINVVSPTVALTVNSSESSSDIKIFDTGTQTIEASATGTSADTENTGTYDWTIQKAGFLPQRGTAVVLGSSSVTVDVTLVEDPVYNSSHGLTFTTDYSYNASTRVMTIVANQEGRDLYSALIDDFISETSLRNCPFPLVAVGPDRIDFAAVGYYNTATTVGATIDSGDITFWKGAGMEWEHDTTGNPTKKFYSIKSSNTLQAGTVVGYTQVLAGTPSECTLVSNQVNQVIQFFEDTNGDGTPDYNYTGHLLFKGFQTGYYQARWDVINDGGASTLESYEYNISLLQDAIAGTTGDQTITITTLTDHTSSPLSVGGKSFDYELVDPGANDEDDLLAQYNYDVFSTVDTSISGTLYTSYQAFDLPDLIVEAGSNIETERGYFEGDGAATDLSGVYLSRSAADHPGIARFQSNDGTYYTPATVAQISVPNVTAGRIQVVNETGRTASAWAGTTAYSLYDKVLRSTGTGSESGIGLYFQCTTAGTSSGTEPTWDTTPGNTTADGTVTWTCRAIEFDNTTTTSGYSNSWTDHEDFDNGDTIRVRWVDEDDLEISSTGVATTAGTTSFLNTPEDDTVYDSYSIDGSTVTEYSADYPNVQVDLNDPDNVFYIDRFYAWHKYNLTTADGIRNFFGAVTATDTSNVTINNSVVDIYFDNTKTSSARQGDQIVIQRADGAYPQVTVTSGGGGLGFYYSGIGYTVETGVSGLTAQESSDLALIGTVDTNVDGVKAKTDQLTFTKTNELDSNIQSVNDVTVTGTGASGDEWGP